MQPDALSERPALVAAWRQIPGPGNDQFQWVRFNTSGTITYTPDDLCVRNCDAVEDYVEVLGTDNQGGVCIEGWWGTCLTLEDQERRAIRDMRSWQGVFDNQGRLSEDFLVMQVEAPCAHYFEGGCDRGEIVGYISEVDEDDREPPSLSYVAGSAIQRSARTQPLVFRAPLVASLARMVVEGNLATSGVSVEDVEEGLRRCAASSAAQVLGLISGAHPCELMAVFLPGSNGGEATQHAYDAIEANPLRGVLRYESRSSVLQRLSPDWYDSQPECNLSARTQAAADRPGVELDCDEFPLFSTRESGPGASLRLLRRADNRSLGGSYGGFLRKPACKRKVDTLGQPFLVVPMVGPLALRTFSICGIS